MSESEKVSEKSKAPVECAKCGHTNAPGTNHCVLCGSRLYISCHNCGHSTMRVASRCGHCGHRLHRSLWNRAQRRFFGRNPKITPFQIILLIAFVVVAYKVIVYIVEYRPPTFVGQ
jgi:uncharacterized membrane protein YvbJ